MNKQILSILLVFSAAFAACWGDGSANPVKQTVKFYILPIENITSENSNSFQIVVFRSIYNFMRIIPSLEVPDDKLMNDLFFLSPMLERWDRIKPEHAPKEVLEADYILYGGYEIKQKDPEKVIIKIGVWSRADNKNIFQQSYETATDIDIFDSIDLILKNVIENVLKIDYSLARIDFDIKTGSEKYIIYINNQLIDAADKKNYRKSMSVLGGQSYNIRIVRPRDGRVVYDVTKIFGAKETFAVTYFATGSIIVDPVQYASRGDVFAYSIDGKPVYENEFISNMNALTNHNIRVTDQRTNLVYESPFNVLDGETIHVTPAEKWGGPFHLLVYAGGTGYGGLGLDFFPSRYLWVEAGSGVSLYDSDYDISPYIGLGYYFYGDMSTDMRFGAGLTGSYYMYMPPGAFSRDYSYSAGVFAVAEWRFISLKAGVSYDFLAASGQIFPVVSIGFKL
jgi:hypothetical protein